MIFAGKAKTAKSSNTKRGRRGFTIFFISAPPAAVSMRRIQKAQRYFAKTAANHGLSITTGNWKPTAARQSSNSLRIGISGNAKRSEKKLTRANIILSVMLTSTICQTQRALFIWVTEDSFMI